MEFSKTDFFKLTADEALSLAAKQIITVMHETDEYRGNDPEFFRYQIFKLADAVRFLGALMNAHLEDHKKEED